MKNKPNYFKLIILILFFVFIVTYISKESGYYEYENYKKTLVIKNAIETFENDVKEGKNVNNKTYLEDEYKDYSSKTASLGIKSSIVIDNLVKKGFQSMVKFVKIFFT